MHNVVDINVDINVDLTFFPFFFCFFLFLSCIKRLFMSANLVATRFARVSKRTSTAMFGSLNSIRTTVRIVDNSRRSSTRWLASSRASLVLAPSTASTTRSSARSMASLAIHRFSSLRLLWKSRCNIMAQRRKRRFQNGSQTGNVDFQLLCLCVDFFFFFFFFFFFE
jgi:hypothetical protein